MDEERMKILNMIQEGKITAEQGAKLLEALEESEPEEKNDIHSTTRTGKFVKIKVTDIDTGKAKVNLSIPMGIAYIIKSLIPPNELEKLEHQGINIDLLFKHIDSGKLGKLLDVEDQEHRHHVEITIE